MAGNTVYVQGSYVDVHDNEVVNLSIDKATVTVGDGQKVDGAETVEGQNRAESQRNEELFHFVHPEFDDEEAWLIHDAVKRVVKRQGIQEICQYLLEMRDEKKVLLPQNAEKLYNELVRMGMPDGEGFSLKTFMRYYKR